MFHGLKEGTQWQNVINLVSFYENSENQCKIAYLRGSSKGYFLLFEAEVFEISRQIRNPVVKVYWESHDRFSSTTKVSQRSVTSYVIFVVYTLNDAQK